MTVFYFKSSCRSLQTTADTFLHSYRIVLVLTREIFLQVQRGQKQQFEEENFIRVYQFIAELCGAECEGGKKNKSSG